MSNVLVKFITNDEGTPQENYWHLHNPHSPSGNSILCTGEYYGEGDSGVTYTLKVTKRGGITCPTCLDAIKALKKVLL